MTVELRAVEQDGTLVSVIDVGPSDDRTRVTVESVRRELILTERMELSMGSLQTGAGLLDLFGHETQLWVDGDFYGWFRPARHGTDVAARQDTHRVTCDGLFSYYRDLLVGPARPNHIVSPHEDVATGAGPPTYWQINGNVEEAALVTNNAEFWDYPTSLQLNNSEADEDAYAYQRFTVPPELDLVPFSAMAYGYVADDLGGAPAYGGSALNERGLMIQRLSSSGVPVSKAKHGKLTDETPRNGVQRFQTPEVLPRAGEQIEVRLYAPKAWTVWRFAALYDGRAVKVDREDKSAAVVALANHAIWKYDFGIGTDVVSLGEQVSMAWPWWRRDNIGDQIDALADTFEMEMHYPTLTPGSAVRNLRVRREVGTDRTGSVTFTKEDFVAWSLAAEIAASANRVFRQGEGSGVARDEWVAEDLGALNGFLRERLVPASLGESLVRLRDNAQADLDRLKGIQRLPKVSIVGDLAVQMRPGDRVNVDLDHGPAQYEGEARVTAVEFSPQYRRAALDLVPVS